MTAPAKPEITEQSLREAVLDLTRLYWRIRHDANAQVAWYNVPNDLRDRTYRAAILGGYVLAEKSASMEFPDGLDLVAAFDKVGDLKQHGEVQS